MSWSSLSPCKYNCLCNLLYFCALHTDAKKKIKLPFVNCVLFLFDIGLCAILQLWLIYLTVELWARLISLAQEFRSSGENFKIIEFISVKKPFLTGHHLIYTETSQNVINVNLCFQSAISMTLLNILERAFVAKLLFWSVREFRCAAREVCLALRRR